MKVAIWYLRFFSAVFTCFFFCIVCFIHIKILLRRKFYSKLFYITDLLRFVMFSPVKVFQFCFTIDKSFFYLILIYVSLFFSIL